MSSPKQGGHSLKVIEFVVLLSSIATLVVSAFFIFFVPISFDLFVGSNYFDWLELFLRYFFECLMAVIFFFFCSIINSSLVVKVVVLCCYDVLTLV